jgi:transcriptional regulator with XRE-family HTH domain
VALDAGGHLSTVPSDATPQLDVAELESLLATRLKERRQELGLKLTDVAAAADVSIGYLSTIEKGTSVPSLPVLARLAHALELSLSELLRTSGSARVSRGRIGGSLGTTELVGDGSRLQIVRSAARPGSSGVAPVTVGGGDVFVYVVQGSLEIVVDGTAFEVADGDALHCDVPASVTWRVTGETRAITVWTAARPIQRGSARP